MNAVIHIIPDEGYKGLYYTSDIAHKDNEGDFVVIGRVEDVIKFGDRFLNLPLIEESLVSSNM